MGRRSAVGAGFGLLLVAGLVAFLPAATDRASCGWWGSPNWGESESRALVEKWTDLAERSGELPADIETTPGSAAAGARYVAENYSRCHAKLKTRRTLTFVLLGLAVLIPVGMVRATGRREESS